MILRCVLFTTLSLGAYSLVLLSGAQFARLTAGAPLPVHTQFVTANYLAALPLLALAVLLFLVQVFLNHGKPTGAFGIYRIIQINALASVVLLALVWASLYVATRGMGSVA